MARSYGHIRDYKSKIAFYPNTSVSARIAVFKLKQNGLRLKTKSVCCLKLNFLHQAGFFVRSILFGAVHKTQTAFFDFPCCEQYAFQNKTDAGGRE